jgi:hypothetical protein
MVLLQSSKTLIKVQIPPKKSAKIFPGLKSHTLPHSLCPLPSSILSLQSPLGELRGDPAREPLPGGLDFEFRVLGLSPFVLWVSVRCGKGAAAEGLGFTILGLMTRI